MTSPLLHARPATRPVNFDRLLAIGGLTILLLLLVWHLLDLAGYVREALTYRYQLDYGEGIVWQQMRDIMAGKGYAPLQTYPAIVYHYPPVYHVVSSLLAWVSGMDELFAGRTVSILSTVATAWMVGALVNRMISTTEDRRVRMTCAFLAGLFFLCCFPVRMWAPLMRVDMIAGAFGLAGILLGLRAPSRPVAIYGAGLMFVLAMYSKQISFAAPATVFAVLLWTHPRLAIRGIVFSAIISLLALGLLEWQTQGGFLRHVVSYNVNRFDPGLLLDIFVPQLLMHGALVILCCLGCVAAWHALRTAAAVNGLRRAIADQPHLMALAMMLLFFAIKAIMMLGMMKSGSGYNYMIEWLSAVAIFAALAIRPCVERALASPAGTTMEPPSIVLILLAFVVLPVQLSAMYMGLPDHRVLPALASERAPIERMIAASSRPVIADDMTFLLRAGRPVQWESAITAELGVKKVYDQPAFAALVRARCFGFFVIEGRPDETLFKQRYNPQVAAAIAQAYPREQRIGKYYLHWPVRPADGAACRTVH
jgi:hypothetical protein